MAAQTLIPENILAAARDEYQVTAFGDGGDLSPIACAGVVVGFFRHGECSFGRRIGPIFVHPDFRRLGLAESTYRSISGPLVACVRDDNEPSVRLHEKCGFTRWRRYAAGWWWKRP